MNDMELNRLEKTQLKELLRKTAARLELLKFYASDAALKKYDQAVREVEQPSLNSQPNNQTNLFN